MFFDGGVDGTEFTSQFIGNRARVLSINLSLMGRVCGHGMRWYLYGNVPLIPRIECLGLNPEVSKAQDFLYSVYPI